jgi:hypothetical protein
MNFVLITTRQDKLMAIPKLIETNLKQLKASLPSLRYGNEAPLCRFCGTACRLHSTTEHSLVKPSHRGRELPLAIFGQFKDELHPTVMCQKCLYPHDDKLLYVETYDGFIRGIDSGDFKYEGIIYDGNQADIRS